MAARSASALASTPLGHRPGLGGHQGRAGGAQIPSEQEGAAPHCFVETLDPGWGRAALGAGEFGRWRARRRRQGRVRWAGIPPGDDGARAYCFVERVDPGWGRAYRVEQHVAAGGLSSASIAFSAVFAWVKWLVGAYLFGTPRVCSSITSPSSWPRNRRKREMFWDSPSSAALSRRSRRSRALGVGWDGLSVG